jgi:hypothetical protein
VKADDGAVGVPIAIFIVCFSAGVVASSRWLPGLEDGPVGGLAFFAVCGLLGAGAALVGLQLYSIIDGVTTASGLGAFKREVVSSGLTQMLWQSGLIWGLAVAIYLLAPGAEAGRGDASPPAP